MCKQVKTPLLFVPRDCGRVMHVMAIPTRCNKANCAAKMVPKDVLAEVESNDVDPAIAQ